MAFVVSYQHPDGGEGEEDEACNEVGYFHVKLGAFVRKVYPCREGSWL